ncbi:MAG: calcium-binding protein, partial [Selenomonadaceae bacterium]|nr:calcium-binding protein [Selenomonadaceae bacterium]
YKSSYKTAGYSLVKDNKSISYTEATTAEILAIVTGIKSTNGLSVSGKVVTVAKSSVNKKKITISGDGYTLKLDDDVPKPSTKKAAWSLDGTTATYKSSYKTAGYSLAKDNKSISYTEATTAEILATVTGIKSTKGLSVNGNVVTVKNSALNKEKVTISDGYTIKLADDVTKIENKKSAFSYSNGTATYKSSYKTAGYTLASNSKSISYSKATTAKDLATITGAKATKGLSISGKKITLKNSALNNKVTVSGSYEFNFASDYKKATITGSKNADTIAVNGSKVSINGGKGNDTIKIFGSSNTITGGAGSDLFIYNSGNNIITDYAAEDKISISGAANVTTSGKDVIFNEKLTVKGAADKIVTYYDTSGEHNYIYSNTPYTINAAGTGITLSSSYSDKKFEAETYVENLVTIDATAATQGVDIMGNDNSNKIIGSNGNDTLEGLGGNDTLTGGKGADVFVYYDGEGKDVITDYEEKDTIQIASGTAQISTSGRNVIFKVGKGSITVKNAAKTGITYLDKDDFEHNSLNGKEMVKISDETATIDKKYWKKSFEVDKYGNGLRNIDASATTGDIKITGNEYANRIISGSGNSTLTGGAGNDTLFGDDGENVFVYNKGDGYDVIYNYAAGDKISLTSGTVSKKNVKGDTVILTIGKGKISLSGAADKDITIIEDGTQKTIPYTAKNVAESWFMADDDNFAVSDNQISSIVENSSVNYSVFKKEADLSASNSILPAVSYSGKKS